MEKKTNHTKHRPYLAAMVLGTALAAMGQGGVAGAHEISGQAIQDISRYCTACWRNARLPVDRWGDCTQEVLKRLLERLEPRSWDQVLSQEAEEHKEFIRAIDAVKKRTQRDRPRMPLYEDRVASDDTSGGLDDDRDAVWQVAGRLLSARQKNILQMTCAGWTVADMAQELASTPERVSDEKYKAIQKLRGYFQ
jgi:RNA polymerase sigma factor (sigma-70 family)